MFAVPFYYQNNTIYLLVNSCFLSNYMTSNTEITVKDMRMYIYIKQNV